MNVRPPLAVRARRLWRLGFRSQPGGFKSAAALTAAVLTIGVGTTLVGLPDSDHGRSTLQTETGPGTGPAGGGTVSGQQGHGKSNGHIGGSAANQHDGNGSGGGGVTPPGLGAGGSGHPGCTNSAGATDHGVTADSITVAFPIADLKGVQQAFSFSQSFSSESAP